MRKLGLIAGGGRLPFEVAGWCEKAGRPFHVARLRGFANPDLARFPGLEVGIAEFGKCVDALKKAGCEAVCFAGIVTRPDFGALKPDLKGLTILPGAIAAARNGDDALLRFLLQQFEKEGFKVEGATDVMHGLAVGPGTLGHVRPSRSQHADLGKALEIAAAVGRMDAGQGAVVCDGLVLAIEAQEGTDAMLRRVAELPVEIRGTPEARRGVLAKVPKPIQERRVDLPTIGPKTVELAAAAGLAGIAGESDGLIVLDREAVIETADRLGLFVWGASVRGPDPE
ncbi:MAG TPA: UDP-2,3-diacylglucosamine diphosphatase LpxI [Caulobacteraceae bacterium]|nr:UDP-2,3-diacylglucosamine diphosphatase LpxI [Caulobacteraceae bacterium]